MFYRFYDGDGCNDGGGGGGREDDEAACRDGEGLAWEGVINSTWVELTKAQKVRSNRPGPDQCPTSS